MGFWPVVKRVLKDSDIVIMVVDARLPKLSFNKEIKRRIRQYKAEMLIVVNKIDLLSRKAMKNLRRDFKDAVFVSGINNIGISKLKSELFIIGKRKKLDQIRIGVVGYPNTGKSSIINALAKRAKAKVSGRAGTTRGIQWIKAGCLRILDSPGVIPLDDSEIKLGLLGAKNPERLKNPEKVALRILSELKDIYCESLEDCYGVCFEGKEVYDGFLEIGKKKGFLLKGADIDERRTALFIIRDWYKGKLSV
jgi:ribosome biogenesis GTPase A